MRLIYLKAKGCSLRLDHNEGRETVMREEVGKEAVPDHMGFLSPGKLFRFILR